MEVNEQGYRFFTLHQEDGNVAHIDAKWERFQTQAPILPRQPTPDTPRHPSVFSPAHAEAVVEFGFGQSGGFAGEGSEGSQVDGEGLLL